LVWFLKYFYKQNYKNMKKIVLLMAVVAMGVFTSCEGDQGPQGAPGPESEVFELRNVDFTLNNDGEYTIYEPLDPQIYLSDNILIYRMSGTIDSSTPIWQLIPRTLFLDEGELDYDYDFSKEDFTIYAGGTFDLATTPEFIDNQTFRIVIIPGFLSNRGGKAIDYEDYNAVIKAYNIDDSKVTVLK
jgi:hypothetical protein